MIAWSAFYPFVIPELPGAPSPLVDFWLIQVAREFCERSRAWVETTPPVDAVQGQSAYSPTPPSETEIVQIVAVNYLGKPLNPKLPGELQKDYGNWQAKLGTPASFTSNGLGQALLVPVPDQSNAGAIVMNVAVKPTDTASGVADWVFSRWRNALAAGAKAKLMAMADKPWAQPDRVPLYQAMFEAAIADAVVAARDGFVLARPRARGVFV